jgi:hypothetical protein
VRKHDPPSPVFTATSVAEQDAPEHRDLSI